MSVKHKTLAEVESDHTVAVLKANRMNMTRTAKALGIDRRTLYRKLPPLGWGERERRQWVWEFEQGEREA